MPTLLATLVIVGQNVYLKINFHPYGMPSQTQLMPSQAKQVAWLEVLHCIFVGLPVQSVRSLS
jgi:hypothetical protein